MNVSWDFGTRWAALLICNGTLRSNIKGWAIINAGKKELALTDDDVKRLKIKYENKILWNTEEGRVMQNFNLDKEFLKFLKGQLKILNTKNMIPMDLLPLAEALRVE